MVRIDVSYQGGLRCEAVHGPSGTKLVTDAPVDNHGKGESFSPTDLVATALGTCISTIMGIVAEREKINLGGLRIAVQKEMSADPPRRIARLVTRIVMPQGLTEQQRAKLEKAAHTCPVHRTLQGNVDMPIEFVYA
ncbi:MAG: OsmC-like protein [candidate division NC10 bacterium]|jgi:putative redox protein|nr:OsmC-like protein [candidate division NC10 bacterium]